MSGSGYGQNLLDAVQQGLVDRSVLDQAVARVLYQKFALGLFDKPFVDENLVDKKVATTAHQELARQVAREGTVLLKK